MSRTFIECLAIAEPQVRTSAINAFGDKFDEKRYTDTVAIARKICDGYDGGTKTAIVDAPTGFGKSMLAMLLGMVFNHKELGSYVLVPNKYLQDQYSRDMEMLKLPSAVMLKGQANYICHVNKKTIPKRDCKAQSFKKSYALDCASICPYMLLREKAQYSSMLVSSYHFWLASMNFVFSRQEEKAAFQPRGLTVFDECHMLENVVQDMFSITLSKSMTSSLELFRIFVANKLTVIDLQEGDNTKVMGYMTKFNDAREAFSKTVKVLGAVSNDDIESLERNIKALHNNMTDIHEVIEEYIADEFPSDDAMYSDREKDIAKLAEEFKDTIQSISFAKSMYEEVGYEQAIKNINNDDMNPSISFKCLSPAPIIEKHVHKYSEYQVFMSATTGGAVQFAQSYGITDYIDCRADTDFDFSKSPIIMCTPLLDMSYKNKAHNMPKMLSAIKDIINLRKGENGIIHTGNFEIAEKIKSLRMKNILFYKTSEEKADIIERMRTETGLVICGTSLSEGIDMKDDMARYQILCKAPFASLADNLVKKRVSMFKGWYEWITALDVAQMIGRSNRHRDDWSDIYILETGFSRLLGGNNFPKYIKDRVVYKSLYSVINGEDEVEDDSWCI